MPKRTNDFQTLVALLQRVFAPAGAKITESAIVDVPDLKGGREIDVLLEAQFGLYELKIAVEAKDEGRKMDLTKFEGIIGKYVGDGRVLVDKLVVVSQRGFYANVIRRAKKLGVELITIAEASETNWAQFAPKTIHFTLPPHLCSIAFDPPIAATRADLFRRAHIFCAHGTDHGTAPQFFQRFLHNHILPAQPDVLRRICEEAKKHDRGARGTFRIPLSHHFVRLDGKDYPVKLLEIVVHAVDAVGPVECSELQLTSTMTGHRTVHRARAVVGGKALDFLLPDGLKSKNISLKIGDAMPPPVSEKKQAKRTSKKREVKSRRRRSKS